ncbi:MAG: ribonuclease III [Herpetosiphonaceae bacterium]|nr:ribonuclease III [Herpetosiphonaceae bacterium]
MPAIDALLRALNLPVTDQPLLETALTHRSYVHEQWAVELQSNERLEFLGDSVLNFLAARFLYNAFPQHGEGQLTSLRAALVRTSTLARWSRAMGLGAYIKLGKGEEQNGGRDRDPLLADVFEALLAAIFLSNDLEVANEFLQRFLLSEVQRVSEQGLIQDDKSRLQEWVQGQRNKTPRYKTITVEGPEHERRFTVEVWAGAYRLGVGEGPSKQAAAQAAARDALAQLSTAESSL